MQRTAIIRICVLAFLALLAWWGWLKVRGDDAMTFVYVIAVGAAAGFLVVKYVVPWFGDAVGTALFSSGEMVGEDASMKAAAKLAQGDYEGAIAEHEKSLAENPAQVFPVGEIAKICADKLNDPARALRVLRERLAGQEWKEDDAAFLRFRMVDIQLEKLRDYAAAKTLLEGIIQDYPDSRHRANAYHRVNEVEQMEMKEAMSRRGQSPA
ncbi:MAG TPA: hypothetical protein DIT13_19610 [Verrucomicrobiales bacterium]|nr:hypothetical protein [Verrucomicrobiales bacterium]HRJ09689.1 hypothetical protein [Prosthecobacter sp.]HRK14844.1 hypothetical protein [Prosthecobacter sp.]